jgi:uncharacterized protein YndB with AHSA1/START domain
MEKTSQTRNTFRKINSDKSQLVEVARSFHAPVERLWKAFSDERFVRQWWGPKNYICPFAKMDFREGGKYLLAIQGPDGKRIWGTGIYEEIIPNQKIVYTDNFSDPNGNIVSAKDYGMSGGWPETLRVTIEFKKNEDDEAEILLTHEGIPKEAHDDCVQGWNECMDKMQKLIEHN